MHIDLSDAVIVISPRVNAKINGRHELSAVDVEDACERPLDARWDQNEAGNDRLSVLCELPSTRQIMLILFPTGEPNVWNLATAFPVL